MSKFSLRGELTITHIPMEEDSLKIDNLNLSDAIQDCAPEKSEDTEDGYVRTSYGRYVIWFEAVE